MIFNCPFGYQLDAQGCQTCQCGNFNPTPEVSGEETSAVRGVVHAAAAADGVVHAAAVAGGPVSIEGGKRHYINQKYKIIFRDIFPCIMLSCKISLNFWKSWNPTLEAEDVSNQKTKSSCFDLQSYFPSQSRI